MHRPSSLFSRPSDLHRCRSESFSRSRHTSVQRRADLGERGALFWFLLLFVATAETRKVPGSRHCTAIDDEKSHLKVHSISSTANVSGLSLEKDKRAVGEMQGRRAAQASGGLSGDGPVKGPVPPRDASPEGREDFASLRNQAFSSRTAERSSKLSLEKSHRNGELEDFVDLYASKDMCTWAFDILIAKLKNQPLPSQPPSVAALVKANVSCPLFVTWEKRLSGETHSSNHGSDEYVLRGCIGTLSSVSIKALADYARKSAFEDTRFDAVRLEEVPMLRVKVSLLLRFEKAKSWNDWEIGKHGLIAKFSCPGNRTYDATYLPEVALEQGFTHERAIRNLAAKAGVPNTSLIELDTVQVERYQSSKASLSYDEYMQGRE